MGRGRSAGRGGTVARYVRGRAYVLAALLSGCRIVSVLHAADMPDPGLLEFLGSVDSEDKAWHEYLARTDIDQVAKRAADAANKPVPNAPPVSDPPALPKPTQPATQP
jgi:hypothetical protein